MRVLLADNRPEVRWALRLLLREERGLILVGESTQVAELLVQAQASQPDLILLAWELPGQVGANVLAILHALASKPKVIALSGRLDAQQAALAAGVDAFVSKSDPPEQLLMTLRSISREAPTN